MKAKGLALCLPTMVVLITLTTILRLEAQRKPDWQIVLDQYLAQRELAADSYVIEKVTRARHPRQFEPGMAVAIRNNELWQVEALPFPPQAVRCVLLQPRSTARDDSLAMKREIVFIVYHDDTLWRSAWLIHWGPSEPLSEQNADDLETVGCDLNLDRP